MGQLYRLKDGTIVEAQPDGSYIERPQGGTQIKPADPTLPFAAPKAQAEIGSANASAGKANVDAATAKAELPFAARKAAAETRSSEANAAITENKLKEEQITADKQELEKFGGQEQVDQLIRAVEKAKALVSGYTTGYGGTLLKGLPATEARTLDNVLTQEVKGNVFMQRLQQMKDQNASPNGGTGIGRIMQAEIPMITGASGALDIGMKGSDLLTSLNQIEQGALRTKAKVNGLNPDDPHVLAGLFHGVTNAPGAGPPPVGPSGGSGAPPVGRPSGPIPHADYSSMVGGPGASVATMDPNSKLGAFQQTYRNEYDPVAANTLSAFIRSGRPYSDVVGYAQSHGFNPPSPQEYAAGVQFAKQHGGATNVQANRYVPTTLGERLASSPAAAFLAGAGSGATAGLDDVLGRSLAGPAYDGNRAALAATNPGADLAGTVAGGAAGMFGGGNIIGNLLRAGVKGGVARNALALALKNPVATGIGGDTAYSTLYGASENPQDPLAGAETGALVGPLASVAGQGLTKAAGATIQGVTNPAVQRLRTAGIPLTVGEVLGGGAKKAQDALTSVFGPGNMVSRRYNEGRLALNQQAFNQAGNTIGAPINQVGQAGIQALNTAKNNAYSNALNPVSIDLTTPQAINDISGAVSAARAIPNADSASDIATSGLTNYIWNPATGGEMSGRDFQQGYRGLSRLRNKTSDRVYGYEIGQALGQGQDALTNALQAQNPGAYDKFLAANAANRHLSILSDAVSAAKNQIGDNGEPLFTPAQLTTASNNNTRNYIGNVAAASGWRPFNQLANDAQQVMSSKLPESGTFPRALLASTIAGTGGMFGAKYGDGQGAAEGAIAPLSLLTLLGTKRGQQLLTAALANRTAADQLTGRLLLNNPQIGGNALTAAGIPLLAGP